MACQIVLQARISVSLLVSLRLPLTLSQSTPRPSPPVLLTTTTVPFILSCLECSRLIPQPLLHQTLSSQPTPRLSPPPSPVRRHRRCPSPASPASAAS